MGEDELREFFFYPEGREIPEQLREVLDPVSRVRKISAKGESSVQDVDGRTRGNYLSKVEEIAQEEEADVVKELEYQQKTREKLTGTSEAVGTGIVRFYEIMREP